MPDRGDAIKGPRLLTAQWLIGHDSKTGRHQILERGELVIEADRVKFVGFDYAGEIAERTDFGAAVIAPGFVDLDALADLDTTILGFDNQPAWKKGRVWPRSYVQRGPYEMYSPEELAFQKRFAFAQLIKNGITTALPIASLFYREWGETTAEFEAAVDAAVALGLRVYLGPAYRTGNQVVENDGNISTSFDESRGLDGLDDALEFCRRYEGHHGGLVRTLLAPDRVETCTRALLERTAAAARDLDVPVRLHCCQSGSEIEIVRRLHDKTPPEWLESLAFWSGRTLLAHATHVTEHDLEIIRDGGASIVHCPLVSVRHGQAIRSFAHYRAMGLRLGLGTDTWPPDLLLNMQLGISLCRLVEGDAGACRSEDYFDAATVGGADALGRPDLGRLAPGAKADIVVFDLSHTLQTPDPIQSLMTGAGGRDVDTVFIDGRQVMHRRRLPGFDEDEAWQQAQRQFDGLIARYPERTIGHPTIDELFSSSYARVRRSA
ncbi:MAG: amidohydrolase family protein [Gammaproteobacteria bacterium]